MKKITFILIALMVTTFCWTISAQTYSGAGTPVALGPNSGDVGSSAATVPLTGVVGPGSGEFTLDNITLSLTHSFAGDMEIVLVSPAGTRVALCTDNGSFNGTDTNPTSLVFNDASANDVTGWDGGAPMVDYRAEGGANIFNVGFGDGPGVDMNTEFAGETVTGDWVLEINDDAGGDGGSLFSYEITFAAPPVGSPPVINCPMGGMANTDAGVCGAVVNFTAAVAIDPEDGAIATTQTMGPASGTVFPVGDTTIEFSATDSDGNTVTCETTYTVMDMEAPMAMCQDVTLELDLMGVATITAADIDAGSSDNCAVASVVASQTTFGCGDLGANMVTLTVTDDSGNESTCMATVTITDTTAPVITCIGQPGLVSVLEDFEGATIPTGWTTVIESGGPADWIFGTGDMPIGADFPTNAAIFDDDGAGSAQVGEATLFSPIYDLTGVASASISFDYALQDFAGGGEIFAEVWDGSAWQVILTETEDQDPINSGVIDVLAFANDAFQFRFRYDDNDTFAWGAGLDNFMLTYDSPAAPLVLDLDAMGMATIDPSDLLLSVEDACSVTIEAGGNTGGGIPAELNVGLAGGNGLNPGGNFFDINVLNDVSFQSFDMNLDAGSGNVEVYFKTGTWVGFESDPAAWTLVATTAVTSAGENLPSPLNLDLDIDVAAGETVAFYVATLDLGINYTNGPAGSMVGDILVSDTNIEHLQGGGKTSLAAGTLFSPRNFNGIVRYETPDPTSGLVFTCDDLGSNSVDVTVTDASGNVSMCTATVIVRDVTAPELVCMDATIELGADGTVTLDPMTLIDMGATVEACGIMSAAADITEFDCDDIGTPVMVTLFVNDAGGNLASCSAMVTVVDMLGPVITCPADITVDPGAGNVNYEVPDYFATGEATAVDNCTDPVTITSQDPAAGSFLPDGTYPITLTGTDEYGNEGTCTFMLTVESVLGANDNILADGISLYPNPANNVVTIQNSSTQVLENAIVHDINGRVVMNVNLKGAQGDQTIDVSALSAGVYTVQLTSNVASVVKRLIKK
ncbi:hypothetical protein ULMS_27780 [Patiriisocius marinistellae]|uniref:HYR domain-containing protein n=1 Tax=Patiriisocius marinistellae TaxID=2494560 RepID=A0A5J4FYD6_9FLAO|nr:HYR domain-containing protein [Patiriisocius marinistellae]GEQ87270.1 hypothetical protein ULMS_27780 [Patiriisocius marinistellae]